MRLKKIIDELSELLQKRAEEQENDNCEFNAEVETNDAVIRCYYKCDDCEVIVEHINNEHTSTNVEEYLANHLDNCVEWSEVYSTWQENFEL